MNNQSTSPALSHLSPERISSLINRYYSGENVTTLIKEFGIKCSSSELCRRFPPEFVGRNCPVCKSPLIKPRVSRANTSRRRHVVISCSCCAHKETERCICPSCSDKRAKNVELLQQSKRKAIAQFCTVNWSYEVTLIEPEHLSAEAAIALLSLVRCGGWLNDTMIDAIGSSPIPFVPLEASIMQSLLEMLINGGLIAPSPESPTTAFDFTHEEKSHWARHSVYWTLLLPNAPAFLKRLEELMANGSWPEDWKNGAHILWKRLAIAECWEYCEYAVKQRNLPIPGKTALASLLENLIRDYSVSQCYQLIWNAAGRAVDYMVREKVRPQHAANVIIGNCQRYADRARAEGWTLKGFQRNFDLPRSQLSYVLHDVFFKQGDVGFYGVLTS